MAKFRIFGRDVVIGKRLFGLGRDDDDYFAVLQSKYGTDYRVKNRLDAYSNVVYACVSLIGESVAGGYQPVLYRMNGDRREYVDQHPMLDLIQHPGGADLARAGRLNKFALFEATSIFQLLQGETYWYLAKGIVSGLPREIVILRADRVGIDINKETGEIDGYFIRRSGGTPAIPIELEEMLHFPLFNPKDPYHGLSPVEAGTDYIETDESTSKFTKNFFNNNAGISGVLQVKGEVTKGAFAKFVRAWRDKYEGVDNAGKVAIVRDTDASFEKVGLGLDEIDMSALRKMTIDDVLMLFRVPLPLLGKAEQAGLGRGNVETLEYIFAKYNIDKKFQRFDGVLQVLLDRFWPEEGLVVDHETIIPADKEYELNTRDKGVDRWLTRNEIRDDEAFDPIKGGDQLFVPIQQIPIDSEVDTGGATETQAGAKPTKLRIKLAPKKKDLEYTAENKERFRLSLMRNQTAYERRYKRAFKKLLQAQLKEALNNLEAKATGFTKDFVEQLFDDGAADEAFTEGLTPVLRQLAEQQGAIALVFAGDEESEFQMTANLESFVKQGTRKMAGNFNDETLAKLNATLTEGIAGGEGIGKLQQRVRGVYEEAGRTRAVRVARTETLKTSNSATNWAYKQTGYVKQKQWYVNPGACEICVSFDGKTLPLDEDFASLGQNIDYQDEEGNERTYAIDYDTIENPPLHPNCRCTIIPVR